MTAFLKKTPSENTKTMDEIQEEVELRLVEKLRQCVDINDVWLLKLR